MHHFTIVSAWRPQQVLLNCSSFLAWGIHKSLRLIFATKLCLEWLLSDIWSFVLHFISDSRVTSASWLFEFFKSKMSFKAIAQTSCIPVCSFNNYYLFLLFICHCFFESKIHLFLCGLLLQIRSGLSLVPFFLLFCLFCLRPLNSFMQAYSCNLIQWSLKTVGYI